MEQKDSYDIDLLKRNVYLIKNNIFLSELW